MEIGGQPGNQNAAKGKRWRKALERSLARQADGDADIGLQKVADQVVAAALAGDKDAWQEIGNRMDGKAAQELVHSGDAESPVRLVIGT